jgi:hypothetical membrane protein
MDAAGRRRAGVAALVVGGLQYVILEAIAASAWTRVRYDYAGNYISDLGVPVAQLYRGRDVDSPLAWAMNTAFVAQGLLFALGTALLATQFAGTARRALLWFAGLHGAGFVLVGLFHEAAGAGPLHHGGAGMGVLFGNLVAVVVGVSSARAGLPRWFAATSVVAPVAGLLSEAVLFSRLTPDAVDGLWERGGVYSIVAWEVLFGAVLLGRAAPQPEPGALSAAVPASSRARGTPTTRVRHRTSPGRAGRRGLHAPRLSRRAGRETRHSSHG